MLSAPACSARSAALHRVRIVGAACLPQRGNMIDINTEVLFYWQTETPLLWLLTILSARLADLPQDFAALQFFAVQMIRDHSAQQAICAVKNAFLS